MASLALEHCLVILYNLEQALEPQVESRELWCRGSGNWRKGKDLGPVRPEAKVWNLK